MDPNEDIARLRAEFDQNIAALREVPKGLWAFYSQCVAEGFTSDQAFGMTLTLLSEMWRGASE